MRLGRGLAWYTAAVLAALHLPVLVLMAFSFNASRYAGTWTGFTTAWYGKLLARDDLWAGLRLSLVVGVASTAIATVLGTLVALALGRHRFRGRRTAEALLQLPLVTPEIVVGIGSLLLFTGVGLTLGTGTIILAHAAFGLPFVVTVVGARLATLDPALEEAALTLGADELTALRRVTLPLLLPGIGAGALLAFTLSFDDVVITFFTSGIGTGTLPVVVWSMVRRTVEPTVNAISTLIVLATTVLIVAADRWGRRPG